MADPTVVHAKEREASFGAKGTAPFRSVRTSPLPRSPTGAGKPSLRRLLNLPHCPLRSTAPLALSTSFPLPVFGPAIKLFRWSFFRPHLSPVQGGGAAARTRSRSRMGIEDAIVGKRRFQYGEEVRKDPQNYNSLELDN